MITIQRTVDIPASRMLTVDVPPEVPAGRTSVVLVFPQSEKTSAEGSEARESPVFAPFPTLDELKAEAARKTAARQAAGRDPFAVLREGPPLFGGIDGVEYQRSIRDEWPD